jgi:hypothetical protein
MFRVRRSKTRSEPDGNIKVATGGAQGNKRTNAVINTSMAETMRARKNWLAMQANEALARSLLFGTPG